MTGNLGNYCANCAHPAPWNVTPSPSPSPTPIPTPSVSVGDYLFYGRYPQTAQGNDKTPIEWLVLAKEGNKVLLISRCALDARVYEPGDMGTKYPTWEKSDIRWWLNGTFLNAAFTAEEQARIVTTIVSTPSYEGNSGGANTQDKIWLLSRDEVEKYFSNYASRKENDASRKAAPTAYAVAQGADQYSGSYSDFMVNGTGCCWWWLRSPGYSSWCAFRVSNDGSLYDGSVYFTDAVRPALWLNLDSGIF